MILLGAYVCLIIAVTAYVRGSTYSIPQRFESLARVLGALVGVGFASIGFLLFGNDQATVLGRTVLLLLAFGGLAYASGLVRWRAPAGFALRRAGWFLVVAALAVPTTLMLLMPIACLLVLMVRSTPERRGIAVKRRRVRTDAEKAREIELLVQAGIAAKKIPPG